MSRQLPEIRLRPVTEADLGMFRRFMIEPGLIGLDWPGFPLCQTPVRHEDEVSLCGQ